jgi:hypothetical protein
MPSPLSQDDFDDLHEYIRVQVAAGYTSPAEIVDEAVELFTDVANDASGLRTAALAITDRAIAAHVADQADWPELTDCDRLDAAFAELDGTGIVARQHFSCCGTCGSHDIQGEVERARKAGTATRGFTFFHVQDTEHAVNGESLYLSYGSVSKDKIESVAIGHEVFDVLSRHGFAPTWNGKIAHRIGLPLRWQRRR